MCELIYYCFFFFFAFPWLWVMLVLWTISHPTPIIGSWSSLSQVTTARRMKNSFGIAREIDISRDFTQVLKRWSLGLFFLSTFLSPRWIDNWCVIGGWEDDGRGPWKSAGRVLLLLWTHLSLCPQPHISFLCINNLLPLLPMFQKCVKNLSPNHGLFLCNMCLPFLFPSPDFAEFQEEIRKKQANAFCHMKLLACHLHIILSWILHLLSLIGFSVSLSAFIFLS